MKKLNSEKPKHRTLNPLYETSRGRMYCGDSHELLQRDPLTRYRSKIQMVFTSPPFPLRRKKEYGNLEGEAYVQWLAGFAPLLKDYLTADGSIVIELGNAWESGRATMSTLPMEALLAFKERGGLHLCEEFVCFNPAKLPTPAQWVNVERIRVKDAFTRVWWLSPSDKPKADNRQVLTQYSESMKSLLRRGTYNPGRRPSEHVIGDSSFLKDNRGAIPPNLLVPSWQNMMPDLCEVLPIANTRSNDPYQEYCRKHGIRPHPARMPRELVEFFVRFLTDPEDRVLDPFAGSNTTGMVAQKCKRRWFSIEANKEYASASECRFAKV